MRCLLCENLSFSHICNDCQTLFLTPSLYRRKITSNVEVISFYKYKEIKELLHTKHTDIGFYIYSILAKNSFSKFTDSFIYDTIINSIAIDDNPKDSYSHTAILNNSLKSKYIKPLHSKLRAKNRVTYSGKSRAFRTLNPRDFELTKSDTKEVIIVDDIITTGATLNQAIKKLQSEKKDVLFCLTLADVSIK